MTEKTRGSPKPPLHFAVREQLYQGIAHDLRGALMAIQLSAEELGHERASSPPELVEEIHDAVGRAKELVNELTRVLQADTRPHVIDVHQVIEQWQRQLRRLLGPKGRLTLELVARPAEVFVAPALFLQLLFGGYNLVKGDPTEHPSLNVLTTRAEAGSHHQLTGAQVMIGVCADPTQHSWLSCSETRSTPDAESSEDLGSLLDLATKAGARIFTQGGLARPSQLWLAIPCPV